MSATVTNLDRHRSRMSTNVDHRRLDAISERFYKMCSELVTEFFSNADDFLFRLAENTKDGFEANAYFDQLRVLRVQRKSIEHGILNEVQSWLKDGALNLDNEHGSDDQSVAELSLMGDETLETTLAVDSFSTRVMDRSAEHGMAFFERMKVLANDEGFKQQDMPFNAKALGNIVLSRLKTSNAPLKSVLMLFRLFDDYAVNELTSFYSKTNAWLIEEGVLPELTLTAVKKASRQTLTADSFAQLTARLAGFDGGVAATNSAAVDLSANNFAAGPSGGGGLGMPMGGALGPAAGAGVPQGMAGANGPGAAGAAGAFPGVMIDPSVFQQLLGSVAQMQTQSVTAAPAAHDLAGLKAWSSQQVSAVSQQVEGTLEAGTVSLVAMLFEYILDDADLSAHMKQLLARMQIPIIKVAILDKEFFTDTDHSARLLLNRMARAANGWRPDDQLENDTLLDGMETIVARLNHELDTDLALFDELLAEFSTLMESYQQTQQTQIESIKVVEEAQYEAHQKQDRARIFMERLLEPAQLPESIQSLLSEHWYRLMKQIFVQHGEEKAWKTSARIARELVWSMQPGVQLAQADRFTRVVPKLLEGVADGLKALEFNESRIDTIIEDIRNHQALYEKPLDETVWEAQEKLDQFEVASKQAEQVVEAPLPLPVEEPVVQVKNADLSYYMDQVESLTTDQWFEIEQSDGSLARGCLTLIIGEGSKFVFTDHQGEKIAERSAIGLAMSLRNDQFRMIDDDPLFDRMIDTLVEDLGAVQR